jgi:hypothetical protein
LTPGINNVGWPTAITFHIYPARESLLLPPQSTPITSANAWPYIGVAYLAIKNLAWDISNSVDAHTGSNPQLDIWVTEYDLGEQLNTSGTAQDTSMYGTWAHGLFVEAQTLCLAQNSRVTRIICHAFVHDAIDGAMFINGNSFDGIPYVCSLGQYTTTPFTASAFGWLLTTLFGVMGSATSVTALTTTNFLPSNSFSYPYPPLLGSSFSSAGIPALIGCMFSVPVAGTSTHKLHYFVVNISNGAVNLSPSDCPGLPFTPNPTYYQVSDSNPGDIIHDPSTQLTQSGQQTWTGGNISLPAFSSTHVISGPIAN